MIQTTQMPPTALPNNQIRTRAPRFAQLNRFIIQFQPPRFVLGGGFLESTQCSERIVLVPPRFGSLRRVSSAVPTSVLLKAGRGGTSARGAADSNSNAQIPAASSFRKRIAKLLLAVPRL